MIESAYIDALQIHSTATYGLTEFGMGSPAPRAVTENRPSAHGATDSTAWYGPRIFQVTGYIQAASRADLWAAVDNLKGSLVLGTTHTLKFRRQGLTYDEQATVRVDSPVDIPLTIFPGNLLQFGVSLFSADPRLYTTTLNAGSYDPTSSGSGGLTFGLDFPLVFNASLTSGQLSVTNEGNIDSPPVFIITGPVTNPIIDNDSTGDSIYTQSLALTAGQTLTLDVQSREVTLDGGTSRPDLIDVSLTDWFNIVPGTNLLRLRGSSMSAGATALAVTFRNARI